MFKFSRDRHFMSLALKEAEAAFSDDEVPVGCVITREDKIVARAYNQVEKLKDSTAHAEMIAITQAEAFLGSKWLNECSVYVTIEPCLMCAYAFVLCRVKEVIYGAREPKTGALGSVLDIRNFTLNHKFAVSKSVLEEESRSLIQDFFQSKRK